MKETTINIIDALRGQQAQLKRLLAQKAWISDAPRPELSEIEAQVIEVKRLLAEPTVGTPITVRPPAALGLVTTPSGRTV
jgi:hypothetical protein